jgi:hypothetical protein
MRALAITIVLAASSTACLRQTEFRCTTNAQCGAGGVCEAVNYCSFPDPTCGQRFGDSAGPYANKCVGDVTIDGGVDGPRSDATDAPPLGCPSGYNPLGTLPHRYKMIMATDMWAIQRTACAVTSSSAYLAVPDDLAELQQLDTLAGAGTYWIGIDDMTTENAYVTSKGATATFLPWATGEPDNAMNSDCVAAISGSAQFEDDKCNTRFAAICECEP